MAFRTYEIGQSSITLRFGDLTDSKAEVLVSSDDYMLSMGGGVSRALRLAGGLQVPTDASKMVPANVGDVVVSSAGDLSARYLLHAITLGPSGQFMEPGATVRQACARAMQLLAALRCRSIAFPAIGAGVAGIPYETVAAEMAAALVGSVIGSPVSYTIELYLMDRFGAMKDGDFFAFFEQFAARKLGLTTAIDAGMHALVAPSQPSTSMGAEKTAQAIRRHQIYTMLRYLDARRGTLEAELVECLTRSASGIAPIKLQLDELQALRRGYEVELDVGESSPPTADRDTVFVSSTSSDMKPYRQAIREVIEGLHMRFVGMEDFSSSRQAPADLIRRKVLESETYVGILGMRYGYVDPGTGLSMTELEYHQAVASAKPMRMFVMDQQAPITAGMVESNPVHFAKLTEFKSRVMKDHTCVLFDGPDDLADKARANLTGAQ
ncbi:DUF4062 domain-containing protein [Variovorax sp. J31P179]|uniref:DUF4062 domain-containing protein n=1 Tax=Variovorax sp. J31P179 TaxID=3053508 RepID=UPI0025766BF8|nr:DUF4062 domain-containing protein [Variovorax sp. J31P179]MDM0084577.1 DUF4062 domain-containing protein [Variovorax sp. J31P179]